MDPSSLVDRQAIFPESSNACKTWNSRSDPTDQIKNTTFVHNCRHINADYLPVPNEIRVGDGVAWFSVLGWVLGRPCTSLSTFVAIISSLGERWFVCAEKKKNKQEREEKKLLWLYMRDYFKSVAAWRESRTHGPVTRVWKMQQKIRQNWKLLNKKSQDGYAGSHLALYTYFFNAYNVIKAMWFMNSPLRSSINNDG